MVTRHLGAFLCDHTLDICVRTLVLLSRERKSCPRTSYCKFAGTSRSRVSHGAPARGTTPCGRAYAQSDYAKETRYRTGADTGRCPVSAPSQGWRSSDPGTDRGLRGRVPRFTRNGPVVPRLLTASNFIHLEPFEDQPLRLQRLLLWYP